MYPLMIHLSVPTLLHLKIDVMLYSDELWNLHHYHGLNVKCPFLFHVWLLGSQMGCSWEVVKSLGHRVVTGGYCTQGMGLWFHSRTWQFLSALHGDLRSCCHKLHPPQIKPLQQPRLLWHDGLFLLKLRTKASPPLCCFSWAFCHSEEKTLIK